MKRKDVEAAKVAVAKRMALFRVTPKEQKQIIAATSDGAVETIANIPGPDDHNLGHLIAKHIIAELAARGFQII